MEGTAHATPVAPGDVLAGKYRVERVLGRGAMGVVVAARHMELGELFAIKLMLPQAAAHTQAVERFLREARAAARIKGEHVAKVTDVGRLENGSPYMVMEHLAGSDLQQILRAQGPLPADRAIFLVLQACEALAEAHALGIVHRDLKPSNLFLTTRANGTPCLKILDFGISKQVEPEAVDLTKTGEVFGTPLYMAPEQMARTKDVDARSDIWSVGAVLYELLTGRSPFHATTLTEVIARALQEDPAAPSSNRPDISPHLDAVVLRCLQKRPAERYQDITEFAAALRRLSGHALAGAGQSHSRALHVPAIAPLPLSTAVVQEPPTLPLVVASESGARPALPSLGSAPPAANTASAWGATGFSRSGRGGVGLPLVIGGIVAATCAAAAAWLFTGSTGQSAGPDLSGSSSAELAPPVPVVTASPPRTSAANPPSSAPDPPPSSAPTATSAPAPATVPPTARSFPPPVKAGSPVPGGPPKTPPKKKYQDAF